MSTGVERLGDCSRSSGGLRTEVEAEGHGAFLSTGKRKGCCTNQGNPKPEELPASEQMVLVVDPGPRRSGHSPAEG
jgi:hypothetical protein